MSCCFSPETNVTFTSVNAFTDQNNRSANETICSQLVNGRDGLANCTGPSSLEDVVGPRKNTIAYSRCPEFTFAFMWITNSKHFTHYTASRVPCGSWQFSENVEDPPEKARQMGTMCLPTDVVFYFSRHEKA